MQYQKLGKTGPVVSRICLGTMTFGEQNSETEAHEQLDFALEQGINFVDTAELYSVPGRRETQGLTEQYIGTWLKARKCREKIILATKIVGPSATVTWIRPEQTFAKKHIISAVEGSLKRLATDYLDLYQLHWPERKVNNFGRLGFEPDLEDPAWQENFYDVLETMQQLIRVGKINHFGISNETPWGTMKFLQVAEQMNLPRCVSIQNPYNLLNRSFEVGLSEISYRENVPLLAYSPLAFGLLTGKYQEGKDKPSHRINLFKQLSRYNASETRLAADAYYQLAKQAGITLTQLALGFIYHRSFVGSVILGATDLLQLKENIGSSRFLLSDDLLSAINKIHRKYSNPAP